MGGAGLDSGGAPRHNTWILRACLWLGISLAAACLLLTPSPSLNPAAAQGADTPAASRIYPAAYTVTIPLVLRDYAAVPPQPQVAVTSLAADASFTLSWAAGSVQGALIYTVQESADPAFGTVLREPCQGLATSCVVAPLSAGPRYYRVRAQNDSVFSPWSATSAVSIPIRGGVLVNTASRAESAAYYRTRYVIAQPPAIAWSGSQTACAPGTTSLAYRSAVLQRINYFRAMAGVPADIILSDDYNRKAQAAALVMSTNRLLTHSVTEALSCYSQDARDGAGSSDLFLGVNGWDAVSGYIFDYGDNNYAVGHRRWILMPQTRAMGTGDIPASANYLAANALVVLNPNLLDPRPLTRDLFVAWPAPGYIPYQVVYARWSFSYPGADFSSAAVAMTSLGRSVPVKLEPVVTGYGENTLAWIPDGLTAGSTWPRPPADTPYLVTIRGVIIGGQSRDFSYTVTIFDPDTSAASAPTELSAWDPLTP
ncbi:MAG: CAP domain-containing protein [Anaerolineae bacterium]